MLWNKTFSQSPLESFLWTLRTCSRYLNGTHDVSVKNICKTPEKKKRFFETSLGTTVEKLFTFLWDGKRTPTYVSCGYDKNGPSPEFEQLLSRYDIAKNRKPEGIQRTICALTIFGVTSFLPGLENQLHSGNVIFRKPWYGEPGDDDLDFVDDSSQLSGFIPLPL